MKFYIIQRISCGIAEDPVVCNNVNDVLTRLKQELARSDNVQYYSDIEGLPYFIAINDTDDVYIFIIDADGVDADGYAVVTRVHRDDLKQCYEDNPVMQAYVDEVSDKQLEYIAEKAADVYCESNLFWDSIQSIFEWKIFPNLPCPQGHFECESCHNTVPDKDIAQYCDPEKECICSSCYDDQGNGGAILEPEV